MKVTLNLTQHNMSGRKWRLVQTRIEQNSEHTRIIREIQFRSFFKRGVKDLRN